MTEEKKKPSRADHYVDDDLTFIDINVSDENEPIITDIETEKGED